MSDFRADQGKKPGGSPAGAMAHTFRRRAFPTWLLSLGGWRVRFEGLPAPQGVIAIYPHTSNWDFLVLVIAKWATGLPAHFWAKESLFRIPVFGRWLRGLGGIPVDRSSPGSMVSRMAESMARAKDLGEYLWLVLAPEGTRRRREGWKSGFYRVAVHACVRVGLLRLDYATKEVALTDFVEMSGREHEDMARISAVFQGVRALKPNQASPIRLLHGGRAEADLPPTPHGNSGVGS